LIAAPTIGTLLGPNAAGTPPAQSFQFSTVFTGRDATNGTSTHPLYDANATADGGHFVVSGAIVPAETIHQLTETQLPQSLFAAGIAGTPDHGHVEANDGNFLSGWNTHAHILV
jgi:hypothetical protein